MASGTKRYKYETNAGNVFYAETDDAAALDTVRGAQPTTAVTENITFKVSKNSKESGCKPRHCILVLKTSESVSDCLVNPKASRKTVVVLKKDHTPPIGTEVTVNGRVWIVGSVIGEQMR